MKYINKPRLTLILLFLILIFTFSLSYAQKTSADIKNSVIRLHIIANSDSAADQSLKLKVRNRITSEAADIFKNAKTQSEALEIAAKNTGLIKSIAEDELRRCGSTQSVRIEIGEFPFPTKVYGDIMLPSGRYNAVRIILGNGSGKNWWCVMYPPLCFANGSAVISENSKSKLRESLTADEYALITENSSKNLPVNVRFKIVEILCGK